MKKLNLYIIEKLHINKDTKRNNPFDDIMYLLEPIINKFGYNYTHTIKKIYIPSSNSYDEYLCIEFKCKIRRARANELSNKVNTFFKENELYDYEARWSNIPCEQKFKLSIYKE